MIRVMTFFLLCFPIFLLRAQTPDSTIGVWESLESVQLQPSRSLAPKAFLIFNDDNTFQLSFVYDIDDDKEGRGRSSSARDQGQVNSHRRRCAVWLPADSTCVMVNGTYSSNLTKLVIQIGEVTLPKHAPPQLVVILGPFHLHLWKEPSKVAQFPLHMTAIVAEKGTKLTLRTVDGEATFIRVR